MSEAKPEPDGEKEENESRLERQVSKARVDHRRHMVAKLVEEGTRGRAEIAERLEAKGYPASRDTVSRDLAHLDKLWNEEGASIVGRMRDRERAISLQRYESYIQRVLRDADHENPNVRLKALKLLGEYEVGRRRMLGLDMPLKTALTDPTGDQEYTGIPDHVKKKMMDQFAEEEVQDAEIVRELEGGADE